MRDRRLDRGMSAAGIVLVFIGLIALVWVSAGDMPSLGVLLPFLVPALLVGLGIVVLVAAVSGRPTEPSSSATASSADDGHVPVSVDLDGAERAAVEIGFGAGRLRVGRARDGHLVDGTIVGGGVVRSGPGRVRFWSDAPWLEWVPGLQRDWTVGVTGEVPVDVEVRAGAAEVDLDCRDLRLGDLVIRSGASAVRVHAPRHGRSRIRTEVGAGSLDVTVPDGVAALVRTSALLGSREIDLGRFPAVAGGYRSPGFDDATDRVEIDAQTALGSLRVR